MGLVNFHVITFCVMKKYFFSHGKAVPVNGNANPESRENILQ